MRSHGNLWRTITSEENLLAAWRRVRRGHARASAVLTFERNLADNLSRLRQALVAGAYSPGTYRQFRIFDPKPRTISCAPVADRVVHHALCTVIAPLLERSFVPVSFACREGYGAHAACRLARRYAGRAQCSCKMDVRHYFDSIGHDRLLEVILPSFREKPVRDLIERIVRHPVPGMPTGRGLPIGNLTSQWFANAYLNAFDHAALSGLGGRCPVGYLRYMDDFILFGETKSECWRLHDAARWWLLTHRGLEVKGEATVVAPVTEGIPFLGLRIWRGGWRLQRGRFLRTRRTFAERCRQHVDGRIDDARFAQCCASSDGASRWFGFKGILKDLATEEGFFHGFKPGETWRQLEQQCGQLHLVQPEQQQPVEREQQQRLPPCQHLVGHRVPFRTAAFRASGNEHAGACRPVATANAAHASFDVNKR